MKDRQMNQPGRFLPVLAAVLLGSFIFLPLSAQQPSPQLPEEKPVTTVGWRTQKSGVLARLMTVFFSDREHGWIAGSNSTILATDNGGLTWRKSQLASQELLRDVFFFDSQRGFLLGEYSLFNRRDNKPVTERAFLYSTSDAGDYWRVASLARPVYVKTDHLTRYGGETLLRMHFVNDRVGWICGETGTILFTRDGGRNWKTQRAGQVRKILYSVAAIDESQAWVTGAGGAALRTIDGGENWIELVTGVTATLLDVQFLDAKRGWAVGTGGVIITTTDGGSHWRQLSSGTNEDLNDVCFVNAQEGWLAGNRGTLLHTRDGGVTWDDESLNTRFALTRLFFAAPDCGWVVGGNGLVYKYDRQPVVSRPALSSQPPQQ